MSIRSDLGFCGLGFCAVVKSVNWVSFDAFHCICAYIERGKWIIYNLIVIGRANVSCKVGILVCRIK